MQLIQTPRILIVDDDPDLARMIGLLLEHRCFRCVVRYSGAQAIRAFAPGDVDLIITDLHMLCGDGVALIESIRRTSGVPVIVLTGFSNIYAQRLELLEGVVVMTKPVDARDLLEAVEKALAAADVARANFSFVVPRADGDGANPS
jgi:DNA-binding response OmpR family regulator